MSEGKFDVLDADNDVSRRLLKGARLPIPDSRFEDRRQQRVGPYLSVEIMRLAGEPTRSFATNEIAAEFGISRNHLAKVVRDLADGGFISSQRGAGGGFSLARPPQSITIGEVVRTLEARHALVECFRDDGGSCVLTPRCRLKTRLAAAREAFMRELDATTLVECAYPARSKTSPARRAA